MAFGRAVYNFSVVTLGMGQNVTVEHTFNAVFTLMQIVLTGDQKAELGIYMSQKKNGALQFLQEILHGRTAKVFSSDVRRYYLPTLFPNIVCSLSVNPTAKRKVHLHIFGSPRFSESGFWMLAHCSITRGTVTFSVYQKCEKCKNKQRIKTTLFAMSHKLQGTPAFNM